MWSENNLMRIKPGYRLVTVYSSFKCVKSTFKDKKARFNSNLLVTAL